MDAYADIKKEENSQITVDVLERVVEEWTEFDPEGNGFILYKDFWRFIGKAEKIYSEEEKNKSIIK